MQGTVPNKVICKRTYDRLFSLLDFLIMDPIGDSLPPKIMIEQIEEKYLKSKDHIEQLGHIDITQIKELIQSLIASKIKINLFLREWENVKKSEIEALSCKAQLKLEHAQYQYIEYFLDVFIKWKFVLGKN